MIRDRIVGTLDFQVYQHGYSSLSVEQQHDVEQLEQGVLASVGSVTESRIAKFFNDFDRGDKTVSLTRTFRELILKELVIRKWSDDWDVTTEKRKIPGSLISFTAASAIGSTGAFASLDISFDNVMRVGTNLLKPELGLAEPSSPGLHRIVHHFIIVPMAIAKKGAGIDGTAGSFEDYVSATELYSGILRVPKCIVGLEPMRQYRISQVNHPTKGKHAELVEI
jgi:hypothetical protein